MFYRRLGGGFMMKLLLLLVGIRLFDRHSRSDCDRSDFRARRRAFRRKIREAFDVWDDDGVVTSESNSVSHEEPSL